MDKKRKNILVWALAWAGLLVAVLYSPVGSPGLYAPSNYAGSRYGGMNAGAKITDVPSIKAGVIANSGNTGTQSYTGKPGSQNVYSVSGSAFDNRSGSGGGGGFSHTAFGNQNEREKASGIGGGTSMVITSASGRSSNDNAVAQNTGVVSMSTDMTMFDDYSTNKQSVGAGGDGGTDPGGDPTGPVIPVGDGWVLLMVLVSGYSIWKKFKR